MRILSRCSDIVLANMHAMLDRIESPEAMIGQVIREMEDGLALARSYAAGAIATERRLARELSEHRAAVELWHAKARAALAANRDDLARLALARKQEHAALAVDLEAQHAAAVESSAQVRASLNTLQERFAAAKRKQKSLIARHHAAQLRQQLCHLAGAPFGTDWPADAKLRRWEERLTDLEDVIAGQTEVQGLAGVETMFASWQAEAELELELAALKEEKRHTT